MSTNIRLYKKAHYHQSKVFQGENDGFKRYIILSTCDRYLQSKTKTGLEYLDKDVGLSVTMAVEKDGIWINWRPGWGVDIHWPADNAPSYLSRSDAHPCDLVAGGKCKSDGSSLADGEQFWPAFNHGGSEGVFHLLEEWWRPANDSEEEA